MREDWQTILLRHDGPIDWLTLNRPAQLNALNDAMIEELLAYFEAVAADPSVRVIVINGAGRGFCAGLDLDTAMPEGGIDLADAYARQRRIGEIVMRMRRASQPIISLVHGPACGGGFAIALASDIRIAGETARMNAAFIRLGLSGCDIGVSYFLPRLVGAAVASELLLTGNFIEAERAHAVGLVATKVPDAQMAEAVRPFLDAMLATSPLGLSLTKECLRLNIDAQGLEAAMAMEDRNQMLCIVGPDFGESVAAFKEKRAPVFAGGGAVSAGLAGRVALVTGGSRGIGRAIALALARDGADVAVNYRRDAAAAEETCVALRALGVRGEAYAASVEIGEQAEAMIAQVAADFGGIDILVNNAGIASRGRGVADTDIDELERVMRVHAFAPFHVTKFVLPHMRKAARGDIIMISSIATLLHLPNSGPYTMGKAAMEALARTLAKEERAHGIRTNIVAPGLTVTEMGKRLAIATSGVQDIHELDASSPFGRVSTPEDVAEVVAFLVSDRNSHVNGQKIALDGGG